MKEEGRKDQQEEKGVERRDSEESRRGSRKKRKVEKHKHKIEFLPSICSISRLTISFLYSDRDEDPHPIRKDLPAELAWCDRAKAV